MAVWGTLTYINDTKRRMSSLAVEEPGQEWHLDPGPTGAQRYEESVGSGKQSRRLRQPDRLNCHERSS